MHLQLIIDPFVKIDTNLTKKYNILTSIIFLTTLTKLKITSDYICY